MFLLYSHPIESSWLDDTDDDDTHQWMIANNRFGGIVTDDVFLIKFSKTMMIRHHYPYYHYCYYDWLQYLLYDSMISSGITSSNCSMIVWPDEKIRV
jgi:hypothetical protein